MVFCGPLFDTHSRYQHFKNLMLDFFQGQTVSSMELDGLQHVVCISAGEEANDPSSTEQVLPTILFRVYVIRSKKVAGSKVPRIELEEMGPRMDFTLGRRQEASEEMMSLALKKPKETTVQCLMALLICRSRPRRMLRLTQWETNWGGFMWELKT